MECPECASDFVEEYLYADNPPYVHEAYKCHDCGNNWDYQYNDELLWNDD